MSWLSNLIGRFKKKPYEPPAPLPKLSTLEDRAFHLWCQVRNYDNSLWTNEYRHLRAWCGLEQEVRDKYIKVVSYRE